MTAKEFIESEFNWTTDSDPGRFTLFTRLIEPAMKGYAEMKCKEQREICSDSHVPLGTDYNIHQERETIKNAKQPEL